MTLTVENYFSPEANREFMSVSQYKTFEECQLRALAELSGLYTREETPALLVGSYVDAHFEGTLDVFRAQHPEIFKRDGSLKSEYIRAEEVIARIERDKFFMEHLSGKKQVIMTGEIEGVKVKVKLDFLHEDKIVDLKAMRDFAPVYVEEKGRLPWYEVWRYDLQGAVYREIVRQNTGKILPFYLAAATKEKFPDIGVFRMSEAAMEFELEEFKRNAPLYDAIKRGIVDPERCETCEWCRETKVLSDYKTSEE